MASLTEALRLVISGDSSGAKRALNELGNTAKAVEDNPLRAFRRGLSLGSDQSISFKDRIGLIKSGLTKLKTEGFGGLNGAMQNFGTAVSGSIMQVAAWGTAIAAAAAAGVVAIDKLISKYIEVGKQVMAVSRITGTNAEDANALRVQFKMLGLDVDGSSKSLGLFTTKLGEAQRTGKGAAADAFARLGISLTDQNGKLKDSATVLAETRDALSKLRGENLAAYRETSRTLFGRGFMTLDKWLGASVSKMQKFKDIAKSLGTKWDTKEIGKYLEDSREISLRWDDIQTTIGKELMPLLKRLIPVLKRLVDDLDKMFSRMDKIKGKWDAMGKATSAVSGPLTGLMHIFGNIWDFVEKATHGLLTWKDLLPGLSNLLNLAPGGGGTGISGLLKGIIPGLASEGLVKARPGGTIVRVAEAGEDEVVLKASRLRGAKTTGTVIHLHFNGPVVGGRRGIDELMDILGGRLAEAIG